MDTRVRVCEPEASLGTSLRRGRAPLAAKTGGRAEVITFGDSDCVVFGWCPALSWIGSIATEQAWKDPNQGNSWTGGERLDRHLGMVNCAFFDGHAKAMEQRNITQRNLDASG